MKSRKNKVSRNRRTKKNIGGAEDILSDPVTPSNVWYSSPLCNPWTRSFIAAAWSPCGLKSEINLKSAIMTKLQLITDYVQWQTLQNNKRLIIRDFLLPILLH